MKNIHLISNAHLDPVWLWRWEEGCTESLSTFRTAADLIEEFEEFTFNHNEAILYQWVKDNNDKLFKKIQELVALKKWNIMGGWYLQPDCNMPSGESIIRNILEGRMFFEDNFGSRPTTAINFDSFGHSKGLVQILQLAGYDSYIVCRPAKNGFDFDSQDFIWKGFAGSSLIVHRSDENYNSVWGMAAEELTGFLSQKEEEEVTLFLWGVGDHGGGPSRKDLSDLRKMIQEEKELRIVHSRPEAYFQELISLKKELPIVEHGLNPVAQGCYTSQIRVKQKHRLLENEIYTAEKMAAAAAIQFDKPYKREVFKEAVRDLIFSEFHDALPGSGSKYVEEDTLRILDHGLELMSREKLTSFIALAAGEEKVKDGTSVIMFYNPHPYDITGVFECETGLPKQNWTTDFMYPEVVFNGERIPTQAEKEDSNFAIDWRKKVVVQTTLKAASMNRMDVHFKPLKERPAYDPIVSSKEYKFDNGQMKVVINTRTGLVDAYEVNGKKQLGMGSFALNMTDDVYNPWGIGSGASYGCRTFQLLNPHDGSAFSGLNDKVIPSVRVIEDGEVRTVVEAVFGLQSSKACVRYKLPKKGTAFDVEVLVDFHEKEQYLKLMLETGNGNDGIYMGQIMFAREELKGNGEETVSQKWVLSGDRASDQAVLIMNDGTYGSSYEEGKLGITLLRSAGYTAADFVMGKALHEEQYAPRMEQGERIYHFRINAGSREEMLRNADSLAQSFNEKPYGMAYCPPGEGEKPGSFITLSNKEVIISAFKKAEKKDGYILRLYESTGKDQEVRLHIPVLKINAELSIKAYEIKTFYIDGINRQISETTILEGL